MNEKTFDLDSIELMYTSGLHAVVDNIFKLIEMEIKKGNNITLFRKSSDYHMSINCLEELTPIYNTIINK